MAEDLGLPSSFRPYIWAPLHESMLNDFGLPAECMQFEYAQRTFAEGPPEEDDVVSAEQGPFVPSCRGFVVKVADGVQTRLRYREVRDCGHFWRLPEIRVTNRDIPLQAHEQVRYLEA